jgi:hypothetical protein
MARVQSILTYTLPANAGDKNPPPAPIRCGCDNLLLILEDQSLIRTALQGILSVEIKSVAVSATPVGTIDGNTGQSSLVWKYDYTVEYLDTDLTDTAYRVRKCDIKYNCCYSCGQAYTDRQLEGYVKSVLGDNVNNLDPQIPVITEQPIAVTDSLSIDLTSSGSFGHTLRADAKISALVGNELSIEADGLYTPAVTIQPTNDCISGGIGAPYAIREVTPLGNNVLRINGAPEHYSVATGGTAISDLAVNQVIPLDTDYFSPSTGVSLTNPSACRTAFVQLNNAAILDFETPGIAFRYEFAIQQQYNGGGFFDVYVKGGNEAPGTLFNRAEDSLFHANVIGILPGATTIVDIRFRWRPIGSNCIVRSYATYINAAGGTA